MSEEKPSISISLGDDWKKPLEVVKKVVDKVLPKKETKEEPEKVGPDQSFYFKKHPKAYRPTIPSARLLEIFDLANTLAWHFPGHYKATREECDELVELGLFRRKSA